MIKPKITFLGLAFACSLAAQPTATVIVKNLNNPSKIVLTPGGNLLVTEAGSTPNSGRVSIVTPGGAKTTLLDGLPSGNAAPDFSPDGPNGLALSGNTLYIANGEGDGFVNGTAAGTEVPNPAGPSSPLFSTILKVTLPNGVDGVLGSYALAIADHLSLLDGQTLTLASTTSGPPINVEMLAANRLYIPDARTLNRNSHPFGLTLIPGTPDMLYMADAGMNTIVQINTATGRLKTITRFAPLPSLVAAPLPPVAEAVPSSVRTYGNALLVTLLSGFPFGPFASKVVYIDPATGQAFPFIENVTSAIDVNWNTKTFFVLQTSTNLGATPPAAGSIVRYDSTNGVAWVTGLTQPTSLAVDNVGGFIYVSSRSGGTISRYPIN